MQLGIHLPSATNFAAAVDDVVRLEDAGAEVVWVGESYGFDAVSALGALAVRTRAMRLGFGIIPVYTRTPALLAMTAAGVDALSGGRAILGLGVSGPQVIEGFHDVAFDAPLRRTRAVIDTCRTVWRRERLASDRRQADGSPYRGLKLIHRPVRDRIPVFVAAAGDRNVELAAEVADGWLPVFFWPEKAAEVWAPALAAGAAARSPELAPLEIAVSAPIAIEEGEEQALAAHRAHLAHYIGGMGTREVNFYHRLAGRYGFADAADRIQDLYLSGRKEEAAAAVPDELAFGTSLIGDRGAVAARLRAYAEAGVTVLSTGVAGTGIEERADQLARCRRLFDELADAGGGGPAPAS